MAVFRYTRVRVHNPHAKRLAKQQATANRIARKAEQHSTDVRFVSRRFKVATWVVVGVLTAALLLVHPPAGLVFGVAVGLGAWKAMSRYDDRVRLNRARYTAQGVDPDTKRPVADTDRDRFRTGFEGMAATYEQVGLPESATAYRDLADDDRRTG